MNAVLDYHLARYPLLQAADMYKLVHQSVFGPGHIIKDADSCRRYLVEEMAGLEPGPGDAPTEPLDGENRLVRVNLRPLLGRPGVVERLTGVLVETAAAVHGSTEQMRERLDAVLAWCRLKLPAQAEALAATIAEATRAGYPARHHSPQYVEHYHPAYRVVRLDLWQRSRTPTAGAPLTLRRRPE
jgi:hypothetical protein